MTLARTRLDGWIAAVIDLLCKKDCRSGRCQNDYSNNVRKLLCFAPTYHLHAAHQLPDYWQSRRLKIDAEIISVDVRKKLVLNMSRSVTRKLSLSFLSETSLALGGHCFHTFASINLGGTHNYYARDFANKYKFIHRLSSNNPSSSLPLTAIDQLTE